MVSPQKVNKTPSLDKVYAPLNRPVIKSSSQDKPQPLVAIPTDEAWFWTNSWQQKEQEASSDVKAGRLASFNDVEYFLADLDD